jgi:hypothetical protein
MNGKVRILCLGAGVNSTALLVLHQKDVVKFDVAVFADTGGEHPETYAYLENVIKPLCQKMQLPLRIIKSEKPPLYEFYFNRKIIPTRMFRHCTDHYKIQPLRRFCIFNFPNQQVEFNIGISKEEEHRAKEGCGFKYPLVELGIDREGCKKLIVEAGLPLPIKSGCYFCPFTPSKGWLDLLKKHHDLYEKAEALEKNCSRYPEMTLTNVALEKLRKNIELQKKLCDYLVSCPMCEVE